MRSKLPGYLAIFVLLAATLLAGCDAGGLAVATVTPTVPLQPGVALIARMVPFDGEQAVTPDVQEQARGVMEARAREMGLTSAAVRSEEPDLLIVELRGKDSSEETRSALLRNGLLEIVESGDTPLDEGTIIVTSEGAPTFEEGEPSSLNPYQTVVTSRDVVPDKASYTVSENTGQPEVNLALNAEGTQKFSDFASANIGKYAPVVLDKKVISSPQIQSAFPDGALVITGLAEAQARQVVAILKAGPMPTRLELIETQQLGTSTNP